MSILSKIKRGGEDLPPRIILAGPEGIGKSTFAAAAPDVLIIAQEDGLLGMEHVAHFSPAHFGEVLDLLDSLIAAPTIEYKHIALDTVDWLERSIHAFVCQRDGKTNIEDYGYGKGFTTIATAELTLLLNKLDAVRSKHRVGIILLSHVHIKPFTSPDGTTWDRYEMKGNKNFTGILREWPDACLFAVYEVFKSKDRGSNVEKVVGGERVVHTVWSPGWDAKNRLNLPEALPFTEESSWADFCAAVKANRPTALRERFSALLKTAELSAEDRKKWEAIDLPSIPVPRLKGGIAKLEKLQPKN